MSAALDWNLWRPFFATLAVGTTLAFAVALLMQRWTRSMAWRRTIWQVTFLGLGLLTIAEISGAGRAAWSWLPDRSASKPDGPLLIESKVIGEPDLRMLLAQRLPVNNALTAKNDRDIYSAEEPVHWPVAIWLMGFAMAAGWMMVARLVFLIFVPRKSVRDERLLARVNFIAHRLGGLRRVRVGETRHLAGPIAFGIFRPGISLPEGFASRFTHEQQDAMLAHELAHLTARDPFWHALADLVTAMLWWHPLVWLAKRQLRAASETAADEASLVVKNGPNVLAECLVELGGRLTRTHSLGWLGMAGGDFRSGLGRRVKRLISLRAQSWKPMRRSRVWMVRITAPLALVALALAATVWAQPPLGGPGTLRQAFQRSVLGLALAAALPQATTPSPETEHLDWQTWSHEALAAARAEGKTVLVHFTADWEETAKANAQTSLDVPEVRARLRELGAVALRGDHTAGDEVIANELLAFGRTGLPLTLVYPSDPAFPTQVLPEVLTPQIILDALEQASAPPEKPASKIPATSDASDKNRAPALILQGKMLHEAGKQAEAKAKFEEALKLDPGNPAAKHYLSLLLQAAAPPGSNPYPRTNLVQSNRGPEAVIQESDIDDIIKNRIREQFGDRTNLIKHLQAERITYEAYRERERARIIKLDLIRLEEVSFPGVRLNEVVEKLAAMVAAAYREHKGINFIVATNDVIHLNRPLRNVTLRQALDAIVRSAETRLTYSVEDYAVVISPGPPRPPLHTRSFRIDANNFSRALFKALTTNADQAISAPGGTGRVQIVTTPPVAQMQNDARRYFTMAGVDFSQPDKALLFNERIGQLMVRATLEDLDVIEQAINLLNASPPQLTIEVKLCEISFEDVRKLGLDWFPGNGTTNGNQNRDLEWPPGNDYLDMLKNTPSQWTNSHTVGVLTDPQFRVVLRALEQRQGVNILTLPKVTTLSGRQAQVKTVNVRYVVTDLDFSQSVSNGTTKAAGEAPKPIAEPFELGPMLDVVPYVQADGHTIKMTLIPTVTEFLGYDVENARRVPPEAKSADMQQLTPLPVFRLRQIVTSVTALDGQTVVLAGGSDRLLANPNKNVPLRDGTKPPQEPKKTKLLVFVTATLIDPAGNRLHPPEETPPRVPARESTP